jgi:REP element-mobilizing transposase RayT
VSLSDPARDAVFSAVRHWDGRRIDLDASVVMSDHVHAIFRIVDGSTVGDILHSIKSFSANEVNRVLARHGSLWLDESFDHIIRQEIEWEEKIAYVRNNPVNRELVDRAHHYRWLYVKG